MEQAILTASDAGPSDVFGYSVAISGDTVVVGSYGGNSQGAAYVFSKPGNGWATAIQPRCRAFTAIFVSVG